MKPMQLIPLSVRLGCYRWRVRSCVVKTSECTYFQLARPDVPLVIQIASLVCVPCNLVMLIVMDTFQNIYFAILNQLVNPSALGRK